MNIYFTCSLQKSDKLYYNGATTQLRKSIQLKIGNKVNFLLLKIYWDDKIAPNVFNSSRYQPQTQVNLHLVC